MFRRWVLLAAAVATAAALWAPPASAAPASGLHYNAYVTVPCNGQPAYEVVTYTFRHQVQAVFAEAFPVGSSKADVSPPSTRPGYKYTLRIKFTRAWPQGFYTGRVLGWFGHHEYMSPPFGLIVQDQPLADCIRVV